MFAACARSVRAVPSIRPLLAGNAVGLPLWRCHSTMIAATKLLPKKASSSTATTSMAIRSMTPSRMHSMYPLNSLLSKQILTKQLGAVTCFSSWPGGQPPRGGGNRISQGVGLLGAASVLFGKTKYVLAALKFTKSPLVLTP